MTAAGTDGGERAGEVHFPEGSLKILIRDEEGKGGERSSAARAEYLIDLFGDSPFDNDARSQPRQVSVSTES